ncbi:hypothetical protein M406DRAFT_71110 [Cryphonectria parasitica EP155]|uniref:D-serine dehydratase-like domain-containing protein n=1 Tax=Cryphonectria parasitica (strain ATCC 38755 / EP155) TaxID=660469 RepID=A0A9P4Y0J7_CRYP1|nr:uncharacterized protein M406DRAFT_71110 [Cryphonectria parasitica EP155]KAF3764341.1 hypothetical protein M406DRAFT_71110 [Cryphonectria parasitica EP155]
MPSNAAATLKERLVGKTLHDVPTPSIVLDLAKLEVNCQQMMDAAEKNGIGWRAHIKTHKVGEDPNSPANIIVSTILEAEKITPLLQEFQSKGRKVNVLYSFPIYPSIMSRLATISTTLGPDTVSLMLDHPDQVALLGPLTSQAGGNKPQIFLKIDVESRRAGVVRGSPTYHALLRAVLDAEQAGHCSLHGLYAHAGQSYYTRADWHALAYLSVEFGTLRDVAADVRALSPGHALVLSVGATPTATALQHPDIETTTAAAVASTAKDPTAQHVASLSTLLQQLKGEDGEGAGLTLEVHAGVYPTLDLQQLATHARDNTLLSSSSIGVSVLAEVASLYAGRGEGGTGEALINAGSLALGREPCKEDGAGHYSGWGLVMPWGDAALAGLDPAPAAFPAVHGGWQVGRISQEHGMLVWKGEKEAEVPLRFGQRVRVWPNHSCIAGAGYDHYLVVDSRRAGKEDEVVDVWERWNGW